MLRAAQALRGHGPHRVQLRRFGSKSPVTGRYSKHPFSTTTNTDPRSPLGEQLLQFAPSILPPSSLEVDIDRVLYSILFSAKKAGSSGTLIAPTAASVVGSAATGLFISGHSDCDFVLFTSPSVWSKPTAESRHLKFMRDMCKNLREQKLLRVDSIKTASVPIVAFRDSRSGLSCDVSFNQPDSIYHTKFLQQCCEQDPNLAALMVFIKKWSVDNHVVGTLSNHIPAFGWLLLVLNYVWSTNALQLKRPDIEAIKQCTQEITPSHTHRILEASPTTLETLFRGFFSFYATMPTETVLALFQKIQDPIFPENNVSKRLTAEKAVEVALKIKETHEILSKRTNVRLDMLMGERRRQETLPTPIEPRKRAEDRDAEVLEKAVFTEDEMKHVRLIAESLSRSELHQIKVATRNQTARESAVDATRPRAQRELEFFVMAQKLQREENIGRPETWEGPSQETRKIVEKYRARPANNPADMEQKKRSQFEVLGPLTKRSWVLSGFGRKILEERLQRRQARLDDAIKRNLKKRIDMTRADINDYETAIRIASIMPPYKSNASLKDLLEQRLDLQKRRTHALFTGINDTGRLYQIQLEELEQLIKERRAAKRKAGEATATGENANDGTDELSVEEDFDDASDLDEQPSNVKVEEQTAEKRKHANSSKAHTPVHQSNSSSDELPFGQSSDDSAKDSDDSSDSESLFTSTDSDSDCEPIETAPRKSHLPAGDSKAATTAKRMQPQNEKSDGEKSDGEKPIFRGSGANAKAEMAKSQGKPSDSPQRSKVEAPINTNQNAFNKRPRSESPNKFTANVPFRQAPHRNAGTEPTTAPARRSSAPATTKTTTRNEFGNQNTNMSRSTTAQTSTKYTGQTTPTNRQTTPRSSSNPNTSETSQKFPTPRTASTRTTPEAPPKPSTYQESGKRTTPEARRSTSHESTNRSTSEAPSRFTSREPSPKPSTYQTSANRTTSEPPRRSTSHESTNRTTSHEARRSTSRESTNRTASEAPRRSTSHESTNHATSEAPRRSTSHESTNRATSEAPRRSRSYEASPKPTSHESTNRATSEAPRRSTSHESTNRSTSEAPRRSTSHESTNRATSEAPKRSRPHEVSSKPSTSQASANSTTSEAPKRKSQTSSKSTSQASPNPTSQESPKSDAPEAPKRVTRESTSAAASPTPSQTPTTHETSPKPNTAQKEPATTPKKSTKPTNDTTAAAEPINKAPSQLDQASQTESAAKSAASQTPPTSKPTASNKTAAPRTTPTAPPTAPTAATKSQSSKTKVAATTKADQPSTFRDRFHRVLPALDANTVEQDHGSDDEDNVGTLQFDGMFDSDTDSSVEDGDVFVTPADSFEDKVIPLHTTGEENKTRGKRAPAQKDAQKKQAKTTRAATKKPTTTAVAGETVATEQPKPTTETNTNTGKTTTRTTKTRATAKAKATDNTNNSAAAKTPTE